MFRTPYLIVDIFNHTKCNVIKVVTSYHHEYWYVLGVKRGEESPSTRSILK
nr:hypothetical protein [Cnaphalocrocis medinalis granulovirus]